MQYPTGLYKIASYCAEEYDVIVLDERVDEDVVSSISRILKNTKDVLCLGLSVMTGEQIIHALNISKYFHGEIPIVWGGMHPTVCPKQTILNDLIDYIIIGEGEEAFKNLLEFLSGKSVRDELFLNKTNENYKFNYLKDFENVPYVNFSRYPIWKAYIVERDGFDRAFTIETSRGCPYNCLYCHNSIYSRPYRAIAAGRIGELLQYLRQVHGIDGIVFQEDNFFAKIDRVNEVLDVLVGARLNWKTNSRINYFAKFLNVPSFMKKLVKSGLKVVQFGVESGSPRILKMINKQINLEQVLDVNQKLISYPVKIRYNFMAGFPGESAEDVNCTISLIEKLRQENPNVEPPFLNVYNPYPGTKLYKEAIKYGFREPDSLEQWSTFNWNSSGFEFVPFELREYISKKSHEFFEESKYLRNY